MLLQLLPPELLELIYQTFHKPKLWALLKPWWENKASKSILFLIRHIWMENTLNFQNQQRTESCLMQVWARSRQETHPSMVVLLSYNHRIQIWSLNRIRKTQSKVEFQAILKGGIYLKVAWAVRKDLVEPRLHLLIVAPIVQRSLTKRELKLELLCSTNLSLFWIQVQKTVLEMRMIWQLIFLLKISFEMHRSSKCPMIIHTKRSPQATTWK